MILPIEIKYTKVVKGLNRTPYFHFNLRISIRNKKPTLMPKKLIKIWIGVGLTHFQEIHSPNIVGTHKRPKICNAIGRT